MIRPGQTRATVCAPSRYIKCGCTSCHVQIPPWHSFCPGHHHRLPRELREALISEERYCRQERIQHTDKLIELRARIARYFAVSEQAAA